MAVTEKNSWLRDRSSWHSFRPVLLSWTWCNIFIDTKLNSIDPGSSDEMFSRLLQSIGQYIVAECVSLSPSIELCFGLRLYLSINLINLRFLQFIANTHIHHWNAYFRGTPRTRFCFTNLFIVFGAPVLPFHKICSISVIAFVDRL